MKNWFTVVIPTRDSAKWIRELLVYYQKYDIKPVILLDDRTKDNTLTIVKEFFCDVVMVDNFKFTEGVVSLTKQCVHTPWVLFMHDDEAPSKRLLERLHEKPPPNVVQSVAIPRRWAWFAPGSPLSYGKTDQWPDRTGQAGMDHAWRLFRPTEVRFIDTVHTEGFKIEKWGRFQPEEFFVHFEWVLRTYAQRVAKLRSYDRYRYGYGKFFEKVYLPETLGPEAISYHKFEIDDFGKLPNAYYGARNNELQVPRPGVLDYYIRFKHGIKSRLFPLPLGHEPKDRIGLTPSLENEYPL